MEFRLTLSISLACSTLCISPDMLTWLLFSSVLVLLESGKWMWHLVFSITALIELPLLPIMCECSVCPMSIFNTTLLPGPPYSYIHKHTSYFVIANLYHQCMIAFNCFHQNNFQNKTAQTETS